MRFGIGCDYEPTARPVRAGKNYRAARGRPMLPVATPRPPDPFGFHTVAAECDSVSPTGVHLLAVIQHADQDNADDCARYFIGPSRVCQDAIP